MFGLRLRELRKNHGITQTAFAKAFNISQGTIGMWETGKREPDFNTVKKIAEYFGVSTDYLLGVDADDKTEKNPLTDERQGELMKVLDSMGFVTEDGDLSEHGRKIITDLIRNNADMLKKLYNDD